jgi:tetratricopeptide (TPR) repeat protein
VNKPAWWGGAPSRLAATFITCLIPFVSFSAQAESPYDAAQRKLAETVREKGKDPAAAVTLWQMVRNEGLADPALTRSLFEQLGKAPSVDVQHRVFARRRVAWDLRRTGELESSEQAFDDLGYVRAFRIAGPFDNEGKRGFDTELGPELARTAAVDPGARYVGREREVRFRELPDVVRGGYVPFDHLLRPTQHVCAFAETSLSLPKAQPITVWLGGGGAIKAYFNGQEVLRDASYRSPAPDRDVALVAGRRGENRLLIKSCVMEGPWGVFVRIGDALGEPLKLAATPDHIAPVAEATAIKLPKAPVSILHQLEARARGPRESATALEHLGRFLSYSGADDQAERLARQHSARAAELAPSVENLLFAASLAQERYERMGYVERARSLNPNAPTAALAYAELVGTGPGSERALAVLDETNATGVAALDALSLRIQFLRSLGLEESALALTREGLERAPSSSVWLARLADVLLLKPRRDEALALEERLSRAHFDHFGARRTLLDDALARGERESVLQHLTHILALAPSDERRTLYAADVYDALGRGDLALSALARAIEIAPESAELHVRHARALERAGNTVLAAESLKRALDLRPQDADTRERLEQLAPRPRLDESFAAERDTLIARRPKANGEAVTVLQDLTVATVFENGLGSRFVQFAAEVHNAEGARRVRARSIQFDPESQRVSIRMARVHRKDGSVLSATETYEEQLGEPWYRVYYDTRALVVVFPDLEPGDSLELRYRIDDVAPRNLFADYFGDLHLFGGGESRAHAEYVLITPPSRKLFVNTPKLALTHTTEEREGQHIERYAADNLPAFRPEPDMPGTTEALPYLHVSTYASWEAVGRWWWGLVQDQLYADAELKRTVAQLKQGAKDERELVQRIYGWAVDHTRYVALEFGIHGFLPYRVPDIIRRGFGDCKDKASLIYTMLREAGVDARLTLVRTRQNGAIDRTPASLAVFDHAIAYVPSLDLYLDGTAEHSGALELPPGDQDVMVLVVGPNSAELRTTPVLPASRNLRVRKIITKLSADGSGELSVDEHIEGADAARYRSTFEAVDTQHERLEQKLAASFPGLTLLEHSFSNLKKREDPVVVTYRLRTPLAARVEGGELRAAPTSIGELLRQYAPLPTRKFPLEIDSPFELRESRTLHAPAGYVVARMPEPKALESRFGSFTMNVSQKSGEAHVETRLVLAVNRVSPADYAEFRRFIEQADEALRARVAFAKKDGR